MAEAVQGLKKLNRALKELPAKAAKKALKSASRAGGREIVKAARAELKPHNKTQNLSKSLSVKVLKPRTYSIVAIIGPRVGKNERFSGWYAHIVEFGSAPHKIKPSRKGVLAGKGAIFGETVEHPGTAAHPFLRPGFDKSKSKAVDTIGKKLWDAIKREAAKFK